MRQNAQAAAPTADGLIARLPDWVIDTLSPEQKEAIQRAADQAGWKRHTIDIRLSVPLFRRRYYLTIVGGQDRRNEDRLARERRKYPLRTVANIFFFLGIATIFYVIALLAVALNSAIIEF